MLVACRQELLRFAGRAKREALSAHSKRGLQYMDGIPTHDLISFKQFKEINLASRMITHHLFYLHRQLRKKVLGVKWWDKRREAIREFRRQEAARLRAEEEAKYGPKIDSYSIEHVLLPAALFLELCLTITFDASPPQPANDETAPGWRGGGSRRWYRRRLW